VVAELLGKHVPSTTANTFSVGHLDVLISAEKTTHFKPGNQK